MYRRTFGITIFFLMLSMLFGGQAAGAAPRDLLEEFKTAVDAGNADKVSALLKEGVDLNDAYTALIDSMKDPRRYSQLTEKYVVIIKAMSKAGFDFKKQEFPREITHNDIAVIEALLKAGMRPSQGILEKVILESLKTPDGIAKMKLITDYSTDVKNLSPFFGELVDGVCERLSRDPSSENAKAALDLFTAMLSYFQGKGLNTKDLAGNIERYKTQNRNKPEVLAAYAQLEKALTKSSWFSGGWFSWTWKILAGLLVLGVIGNAMEKKDG